MTPEQIQTYVTGLPKEVLQDARFCVCRVGSKVPYNPKTKSACSPTEVEDFLPFSEISPYLADSRYDVIGIKVGTGGVCAIDIDGCVTEQGLSDLAIEIIEHFHSYTELSPSGTGIRILFHSKAQHDYERHYSKNSKINVESYPLNNNGRMVRLTGMDIPNFPYREVSEDEYLEFCQKYMARAIPVGRTSTNIIMDEGAEVDAGRLEALLFQVRKHQLLRSLWSGNYFTDKSDSETDFALVMHIVKHVTNKYSEIKAVFEAGRWFRLKDKRHLDKWNYNKNQYLKDILKRA